MIKFYIIYPFIFIVLMMLSFKVFAEEVQYNHNIFAGPMWGKFCQAYVSHVPKSDVEYKGGVDIHGKSVVGANLESSVIQPPKIIEFDLDINLAKYLGIDTPKGLLGEAKMANIKIEDGQVYFNNKLVNNREETQLYDICQQKTNRIEVNEDKASYKDLEIFRNKGKQDDNTISETKE